MPTPSPASEPLSPIPSGVAKRIARPALPALTALRFPAAILVVLAHFRYTFWPEDALGAFNDFGQVVSFFFMLSGFLLAYAYPSLHPGGGGRFFLRRIARVWPLHVALITLTFLLIPIIADQTMTRPEGGWILLGNLALVQAWIPWQPSFFSFNIVSWYLSSLVGLYALFPLLIRNFRQTWSMKLSIAFVILLTLMIVAGRLPLFSEDTLSGQGLLFISPLGRLPEFMVGMSLALLYEQIKSLPVYTQQLGRRRFFTLLEIFALILAIAAMSCADSLSVALKPLIGAPAAYYMNFAGLTLLPYALMILTCALGRGYLSQLLACRPAVALGELGFGIYMLHVTLIHWYLYPVALKPNAPQPTGMMMLVFWTMLLGLAWLSHRFFEPLAARRIRTLTAP